MNKQSWRPYLFFFSVVAGVLLYAWNIHLPLTNPDEAVYGETAKEILFAGDWLSPRIYGDYWYDKPPLFYWLTATSFRLFGITDAAARLPSVLAGIAAASYLAWDARPVFGRRAAFFAAAVYLICWEIWILAQAAVTDMTLSFLLLVAGLGLWRGRTVLPYVAAGLALLTKGPVGVLFPALTAFLYFLCTRDTARLRSWKLPRGVLISALFGLPWYVYMTAVHGQVFIETFLGFHNVTRFLTPEHATQHAWWRYLPVLAIGFLPWTALLPALFARGVQAVRRGTWRAGGSKLWCTLWFGNIFIFFSLSGTQLVSYIAPAFAPLALLAGEMLATSRLQHTAVVTGGFAVILAASLPFLPSATTVPGLLPFTAVLAVAGIAQAYALYRGNPLRYLAAGGAVTAALACLFHTATPAIISQYTVLPLAEELRAAPARLYVEPFLRPGLAFHIDRYGTALSIQPPAIPAPEPDTVLLLQRKTYQRWLLSQPTLQQYRIRAQSEYLVLLEAPQH
ncbi:MAG: glycosyltransferase family 39 protein [Veillonellaceae bacterium]|nr:glycosyltransferase family 39 protein [Veillonellaceae bacterium]